MTPRSVRNSCSERPVGRGSETAAPSTRKRRLRISVWASTFSTRTTAPSRMCLSGRLIGSVWCAVYTLCDTPSNVGNIRERSKRCALCVQISQLLERNSFVSCIGTSGNANPTYSEPCDGLRETRTANMSLGSPQSATSVNRSMPKLTAQVELARS